MLTFVVRCEYEAGVYSDGGSFEWPRFLVLGKRADILGDRMVEYAESIPPGYCLFGPPTSIVEVKPFDLESWLREQENSTWRDQLYVAIAGALNEDEEELLNRVVALSGKDCIIVADAHTELQPSWQSVIRLPPHCSWDAQWAWGIRVVLDVLLEAAVHGGLICIDIEDIGICLEGRYSDLAVAHAEGEDRTVLAVEKVVQALSGRIDLTLAEAFIVTFHAGKDIKMRDVALGMERIKDAIASPDVTFIAESVFAENNRFAVSLIASAPFERSQ